MLTLVINRKAGIILLWVRNSMDTFWTKSVRHMNNHLHLDGTKSRWHKYEKAEEVANYLVTEEENFFHVQTWSKTFKKNFIHRKIWIQNINISHHRADFRMSILNILSASTEQFNFKFEVLRTWFLFSLISPLFCSSVLHNTNVLYT